MKFFAVVFMAAFATVALSQESSTPKPTTTSSTTIAPTTTSAPTTTKGPITTLSPTTVTPTTQAPTTQAPTTTTTTTKPPPKPQEATLANYTFYDKDNKVCAVVLTKIVVSVNSTSYPFVNGTISKNNSRCEKDKVTLFITALNDYTLQIIIGNDKTNFYISELLASVVAGHSAEQGNLTQFSTPMKQFYKCASASQVSLTEENTKVIFSEMKYQAFQMADTADFVGNQLECVSDYHSDVVIIAIGCALALLVVVILVAYLIARRRNRQRGYQSV